MAGEPAGRDRADVAGASPASVACGVCGATVAASPPVTWSRSIDGRRVSHVCVDCTRRHVRSMEAKLDQEHW